MLPALLVVRIGTLQRTASRRVLRVWLVDDGFATFNCARCGLKGEAHAEHTGRPVLDRKAVQRARDVSVVTDNAERPPAWRLPKPSGAVANRHPVPSWRTTFVEQGAIAVQFPIRSAFCHLAEIMPPQ